MNIGEMHVTFRELAQQMGMQTVRAILMEDIDICLNAAIIEKARNVIVENVGPVHYNDKVARHTASISPVNALRTLYTAGTVNGGDITGGGSEVDPFKINIDCGGIMLYTGFQVSYNGKTIYDCRIIEAEDLGQTLRDFCNRAAKDAPIVTIFGDESGIIVDIYTGRNNTIKPQLVKYLYINEPAKVKFDEDREEDWVNSDLPPYLHMEIVMRAVQIYLASIGATSNGIFQGAKTTQLLNEIVDRMLGKSGNLILGICVTGACLTTAIGLTATVGDYFSKILNTTYEKVVIVTTIISFIFAGFGVDIIVKISAPILTLIYPIAIVLIILNFFKEQIKSNSIYVGAVVGASLVGAYEMAQVLSINTSEILTVIYRSLPLNTFGLAWILPSIICAVSFKYMFKTR